MGKIALALLAFTYMSFAVPEGKVLFENHCLRCHAQDSPKSVKYLKSKYKGNPSGVVELAKRCPWGQGLSEMEIKLIAEWLSGGK